MRNTAIDGRNQNTGLFTSRYFAKKFITSSPYASSTDVVVKVDGGYTIMTSEEFSVWKRQK